VDDMSKRVGGHRYGRAFEFQADLEGTNLLFDVYYDHGSMRSWLMARAATDPHHHDAEHAPPQVRAQALDATIASLGPFGAREDITAARLERYRSEVLKAVAR
jgi:hypothetical protein